MIVFAIFFRFHVTWVRNQFANAGMVNCLGPEKPHKQLRLRFVLPENFSWNCCAMHICMLFRHATRLGGHAGLRCFEQIRFMFLLLCKERPGNNTTTLNKANGALFKTAPRKRLIAIELLK